MLAFRNKVYKCPEFMAFINKLAPTAIAVALQKWERTGKSRVLRLPRDRREPANPGCAH
jgi:hypothetical protein